MKKLICLLVLLSFIMSGYSYLVQEETLVTPGATSWMDASQYNSHTFLIKASSVSTNVIYRLEGSKDGVVTVNLDDAGNTTSYTMTSSDTQMRYKNSGFAIPMIRLNWLSKSGTGTTPNIKLTYIGGVQ